MDKYIYDKTNGLWYELRGDYYFPCLTLPDEGEHHIGIWGKRHRNYLKQEQRIVYETMLLDGRLFAYLEEIDRQAEQMLQFLTTEMAKRDGITEQLKADNQMAWISAMNNIKARAEEVVYAELIYH